MDHAHVTLDGLILDINEVETLLSKLSEGLMDPQLTTLPSERLTVQMIDLLCRVQEATEAVNHLAHSELKRRLADLVAHAEDIDSPPKNTLGSALIHASTD